jgi:magnesium-transporting ATPase (P-type)
MVSEDSKVLYVLVMATILFALGLIFIEQLPLGYNQTLKTIAIGILLIFIIVPASLFVIDKI